VIVLMEECQEREKPVVKMGNNMFLDKVILLLIRIFVVLMEDYQEEIQIPVAKMDILMKRGKVIQEVANNVVRKMKNFLTGNAIKNVKRGFIIVDLGVQVNMCVVRMEQRQERMPRRDAVILKVIVALWGI
jgi:hypothetical protein